MVVQLPRHHTARSTATLVAGRLALTLLSPANTSTAAPVLAETLAARLAAVGAIFEDALPAPKQADAEQQQRTMRQGGAPRRSESDEDSDFD